MSVTKLAYAAVIEQCKSIYLKKTKDYGTAWRVLRCISLTDQIMIKAMRIRHIQELGTQQVSDSITDEWKGIVNYAVMGLIQYKLGGSEIEELDYERASALYDDRVKIAQDTMENKNHDYGEAWRQMSQESFADLILVKLLRIRQILSNDGKTVISEGIDANFVDILNYAVFALIRLQDAK